MLNCLPKPLGILLLSSAAVAAVQPWPCAAQQAASSTFHWLQDNDRSIALAGRDGVVWQFNFGREQTKPNFYPLGLPGVPSLAVDRPPDHSWHHGLWFSWTFINGVNFWEHVQQTGRPQGRTEWTDVHVTPGADNSAEITLDLTYSVPDKTVLLTERRTLFVSAPYELGQYSIDWLSEFRAAGGDVTLACVPIPPTKDGVPWGGFGGLSVRFAQEFGQRQACSVERQVAIADDGIYRGTSVAFDYSGLRADRAAGIAILDHPTNPRHPADWYVIQSEMGFLNAAFLSNQPFLLRAGERLTLRYRVVIHAGRWDPARLQTEYQKFVTP